MHARNPSPAAADTEEDEEEGTLLAAASRRTSQTTAERQQHRSHRAEKTAAGRCTELQLLRISAALLLVLCVVLAVALLRTSTPGSPSANTPASASTFSTDGVGDRSGSVAVPSWLDGDVDLHDEEVELRDMLPQARSEGDSTVTLLRLSNRRRVAAAQADGAPPIPVNDPYDYDVCSFTRVCLAPNTAPVLFVQDESDYNTVAALLAHCKAVYGKWVYPGMSRDWRDDRCACFRWTTPQLLPFYRPEGMDPPRKGDDVDATTDATGGAGAEKVDFGAPSFLRQTRTHPLARMLPGHSFMLASQQSLAHHIFHWAAPVVSMQSLMQHAHAWPLGPEAPPPAEGEGGTNSTRRTILRDGRAAPYTGPGSGPDGWGGVERLLFPDYTRPLTDHESFVLNISLAAMVQASASTSSRGRSHHGKAIERFVASLPLKDSSMETARQRAAREELLRAPLPSPLNTKGGGSDDGDDVDDPLFSFHDRFRIPYGGWEHFIRSDTARIRAEQGAHDLEQEAATSPTRPPSTRRPFDPQAFREVKHLNCYERLSFTPATIGWTVASGGRSNVGAARDLRRFRRLAWESLGAGIAEPLLRRRCPPRRIVVVQRPPPRARRILNMDQVVSLLRNLTNPPDFYETDDVSPAGGTNADGMGGGDTGSASDGGAAPRTAKTKPIDVVVLHSSTPSLEQASLFASAGLLLSSHGAQLSNLLFSPPHGVVIEVEAEYISSDYPRFARNAGVRLIQAIGGTVPAEAEAEQERQRAASSRVRRGQAPPPAPHMRHSFAPFSSLLDATCSGDSVCALGRLPEFPLLDHVTPDRKDVDFVADLGNLERAIRQAIAHLNWACGEEW